MALPSLGPIPLKKCRILGWVTPWAQGRMGTLGTMGTQNTRAPRVSWASWAPKDTLGTLGTLDMLVYNDRQRKPHPYSFFAGKAEGSQAFRLDPKMRSGSESSTQRQKKA